MASSRLELVHGRAERMKSGRQTTDLLVFWSYLLLWIPAHRIALTRLLRSNHALAVECGRWLRVNGTAVTVQGAFGSADDVKDECHVLFICSDATLQAMRDKFLADIWKAYPALHHRSSCLKELLHMLLTYSDLLPRLACYVYHVIDHVESIPMYIHPGVYDTIVVIIYQFSRH